MRLYNSKSKVQQRAGSTWERASFSVLFLHLVLSYGPAEV